MRRSDSGGGGAGSKGEMGSGKAEKQRTALPTRDTGQLLRLVERQGISPHAELDWFHHEGTAVLLESSVEKRKELRLRLHISWVQIRALRLTARPVGFDTYVWVCCEGQ